MPKPRVFVSHSHNDDAFARRFVSDIQAAGMDAWLDSTALSAGNFLTRISEALGACDWFILVLTPSALTSTWVRHEVDAAILLRHQHSIHDPIFVKAATLDLGDMPALWRVYHVIDATADYESALAQLVREVTKSEAYPPSPTPDYGSSPIPVTIRQSLFGDAPGVECAHCGTFNLLEAISKVSEPTQASLFDGGIRARCLKCGSQFSYTYTLVTQNPEG